MKRIIAASLVAAGVSLSAGSAQAACGKVTISDMNWNSASLIANIDRFILAEGYGCDAELIAGDTMPTGTSMIEKGEPDIAPEFWTNNFKELLPKAIKEKRVAIAGDALLDGGEEGFWVPQYMVDADPSLATISGVLKNAKKFPNPEDPSRGAFYNCPAGWGCQVSNTNLYKAMKMEDAGFDLVDPGTAAALSGSISKAYDRKQAWLGYYWAPTAILGKYKMVKVDFESGIDQKHFDTCITQEDCKEPHATMYPPAPVKTLVVASFPERAPEAYAYLGKRGYHNDQMNELLAWMEQNQAEGRDGMAYFMQNYESTWSKWVPADVAEKLKAAAAELPSL